MFYSDDYLNSFIFGLPLGNSLIKDITLEIITRNYARLCFRFS